MNLLTVIVLLPLAGFVLNGLLGQRLGKQFVSIVGCGLPILAFLAAVRSFLLLQGGDGTALVETAYTWSIVGDFSFDINLYFDRLSAVMTLIVTGVGSLIHVYSTGYMKDDASYARYFAYLNVFLFFMLMLVEAAPDRLGFQEEVAGARPPVPAASALAEPPAAAPMPPPDVAREAEAIADPDLRRAFVETAGRYLARAARPPSSREKGQA